MRQHVEHDARAARSVVQWADPSVLAPLLPGSEMHATPDAPLTLLSGLPILLKDNIETRDMPTTAGSLALVVNAPGRDAPIVARLRDAGAVILGKTNLSEWANIRSSDSISGWSAVGGQTRNPYDPARTPCGSSSGSAGMLLKWISGFWPVPLTAMSALTPLRLALAVMSSGRSEWMK